MDFLHSILLMSNKSIEMSSAGSSAQIPPRTKKQRYVCGCSITYVLWPANIEQRRASTVLLAIEYNALRVPHLELDCRFSRSDSRLRRGLQFLGTHSLCRLWIRASNMGILAGLFDPKLAVHFSPRSRGEGWLVDFP